MSLRDTSPDMTFCEYLRSAFDIVNKHRVNGQISEKDYRKIYNNLSTAEDLGKKMATKLYEYNKEFDKDWWDKNPKYEKKLKERLKWKVINE